MDTTLRCRLITRSRDLLLHRLSRFVLGSFLLFGALLRLVMLDRYPPGLHFDEAVYGLLARDILNGARPIFFSAWTGREPLYMYLMAGIQALVGVNTLAIRLTSALIGVATLPATYWLGRALFNRWVGLLATGLLATNYWHLTVSRNGYPNILIPPLEALSFYFLWQAYQPPADEPGRHNQTRLRWPPPPWLAALVGGALAGLVLYTYLAARFFPITLLAIALYALVSERRQFVQRLPALALATLSMLIVVTPLAIHFLHHPADFTERADQVLIFTQAANASEGLRLFLQNIWQTALAFFVRGDPRWHYNLPGKPIFDPLLAIFFVIGCGIALRRHRLLPYAAMLIWTAVMCLPGILTADLQPAGQRIFGVFPALVLLPALGLEKTTRWILARRPQAAPLVVAGLGILFVWEGYQATQTYFGKWVREFSTYEIFNGDYVQMADLARTEMAAGHTVVFVSEHYKHPTVAYLAPETMDSAVWVLGEHGLVYPARNTPETVYLVPREPFPPGSRVDQQLAARAHTVETVADFAGRPAFTVYRVRPDEMPAEASPPTHLFNNEVAFRGGRWPDRVDRNTNLPVTIQWQVLNPTRQGRTFALHLLDQDSIRWAQIDSMGYLSEQWQPGDWVEQWFDLPIDPTTPAGPYTLQLALTDEAAHPLPVLNEQQVPIGVWLTLGQVALTPAGGLRQPVGPGRPVDAGLQILEIEPLPPSAVPGAAVMAAVRWQKIASETTDAPVQLAFVTPDGKVWHSLTRPVAGLYPPTRWQIGEVVQAWYQIPVPADAPSGQSILELRRGTSTVVLGKIDIQAAGRLFTIPDTIQTPFRATFGAAIQFLGYDLPEATYAPGETVALTLYWQALQPAPGNYKVFTHVLDSQGQLRAQQDQVPAAGARPTTGWIQGEVIVDEYRILLPADLAPGTYQIEIGLYDETTLVRLPAFDAQQKPLPDNRVLLPHTLQVIEE